MTDIVAEYYASLQHAFAQGPPAQLSQVADALLTAYLHRAQVYTVGNGACAALAAHMACDLGRAVSVPTGSGRNGLAARLRVTSLADNAALVTANANDFLYEDVFVEQLRYRLDEQDVVIAMSCSGGSPNVLRTVDFARACGALTIGFTGGSSRAADFAARCDIAVRSAAVRMEQVEDMHVAFHHIVTLMLRQRIRAHLAGPAPTVPST